MEKIKEDGLAKHIGVSKFNVQLLNDLYAAAKIKPEDHQVDFIVLYIIKFIVIILKF